MDAGVVLKSNRFSTVLPLIFSTSPKSDDDAGALGYVALTPASFSEVAFSFRKVG